MMVAALLGTLAVSSCVDDKETPEVTDARQTTADLLAAQNALKKASAEILKINSDAEVAVITAKAQAQEAQALIAQTEAARLEKENEIEVLKVQLAETQLEEKKLELQVKIEQSKNAKAEMELTIENSKQALANAEKALETAKIDSEKQLAQIQHDLLKAQLDHNYQLIDDLTAMEHAAYNNYSASLSKLSTATEELNDAQLTLVRLELGLEDAKDVQAKKIAEQERIISDSKVKIEYYKKYTNYIENGEYEEMKSEAQKLQNDANAKLDESLALYKEYEEVSNKYGWGSEEGIKAQEKYSNAQNEYFKIQGQIDEIYAIIYLNNGGTSAGTLLEKIEECEEAIKDAEDAIAAIKASQSSSNGVELAELAIEKQKAIVEVKKSNLQAATLKYEAAKAIYEELVSEEE